MATVVILISHDHEMAVTQALHVRYGILLLMLKSHKLLDVLDLSILHDLIDSSISNIEEFTTKREHTKQILVDNSTTSQSKYTG